MSGGLVFAIYGPRSAAVSQLAFVRFNAAGALFEERRPDCEPIERLFFSCVEAQNFAEAHGLEYVRVFA